LSKVARK